jgi:hypothetical protein
MPEEAFRALVARCASAPGTVARPVAVPLREALTVPLREAAAVPLREEAVAPLREAVDAALREALTVPLREAAAVPFRGAVDAASPASDSAVSFDVDGRRLDVFGTTATRSARPTAGAVGIPTRAPSDSGSAVTVTGGIAASPVAGAVLESAAIAAADSPGSIGAIGTPRRPAVPVAGIEAAAAPAPGEIASPSGRGAFRVPPDALDAFAGRAAASVAGEESPGRAERDDVVAEVLADFLAAAMVGPPWDFCACATAPGAVCAGAVRFACAAARSGCRSGLALSAPAFVLGLPRLVALLDLLQGVRGVFRGGEGADQVFGRAQVRVCFDAIVAYTPKEAADTVAHDITVHRKAAKRYRYRANSRIASTVSRRGRTPGNGRRSHPIG